MPLDDHDAACVWDMLRFARIATELIEGREQSDLGTDIQFRLAVERAIEIIGEAARGISDSAERANPDIPWKKIVQQRHVIAHDYADLNYTMLWRVVTVHIPPLVQQLEKIATDPPTDDDMGPTL